MGLPFTTQQVLSLLGFETNHSGYMKCPYCNSRRKPFHWNFDKNVFRCNENPEHKGNILVFYKDMVGLSDTKEAYHEIIEKLNLGDTVKTIKYEKPAPVKDVMADIDRRDYVYRKMLAKSYLSEKNKADMLARGFTEDEMIKVMYKTFPDRSMNEIFDFIRSLEIDDFSGIPGFYTTKNNNWFMQVWKRGILVPYIDIHGKIQLFQIRKDKDVLEIDEDGNLENKYMYFASRPSKDKNPNGTAAKQCVHFACDFIEKPEGKIINIRNGVMLLTEGAMKADLYHCISGMPTIAVPGVNCLDALKEVLPDIKNLGVYRIILGYDMDRVQNINVMEALYKMKALILSYGFECPLLEWSNEVVMFNGNHEIMDCDTTFVVTPDTLQDMQDRNMLEDTLKRAIKLDIDTVLYAFENKETAIQYKDTFKDLNAVCDSLNLNCSPCFWKLNLKGIDDKYAYEQRGIMPH